MKLMCICGFCLSRQPTVCPSNKVASILFPGVAWPCVWVSKVEEMEKLWFGLRAKNTETLLSGSTNTILGSVTSRSTGHPAKTSWILLEVGKRPYLGSLSQTLSMDDRLTESVKVSCSLPFYIDIPRCSIFKALKEAVLSLLWMSKFMVIMLPIAVEMHGVWSERGHALSKELQKGVLGWSSTFFFLI